MNKVTVFVSNMQQRNEYGSITESKFLDHSQYKPTETDVFFIVSSEKNVGGNILFK